MKKILLRFMLLALFYSCSFESEGVFTDDTTEEYELYDYYVDSYGNEGIVAYIHHSSRLKRKHIIVISADESYQSWGPIGERVYKSDSVSRSVCTASEFGLAVLQSMCSIGMERYPAQSWCYSKNQQEVYPRAGSWRLPSENEFKLTICGSKAELLNSALKGIGGTPILTNQMYWTCTEDFDNYIINGDTSDYDCKNRAVIISPTINTYFNYSNKERWLKKNKYYVRAIKYVYYHY